MYKVIAQNGDVTRYYNSRRELAKDFDMSISLLNDCIRLGRSKAGWTFDTIASEQVDDSCGLAGMDFAFVHENLLRLFHKRKITVNEIAEALDVTSHTVSNWLTGNSPMRVENMLRIARILEIDTLDELFRQQEKSK